ncbi:Serine hydrolase-like protein [Fragariocoptes setiger]|uniref:Serine hydrolase-like protein n=1 Tax=Fragariocoptes setiger TaxID=1670756 RepID=A0ABQ7S9E1_9ACAR|nr:Serine hydrolase-like protein [Fragariocoptes setiger]
MTKTRILTHVLSSFHDRLTSTKTQCFSSVRLFPPMLNASFAMSKASNGQANLKPTIQASSNMRDQNVDRNSPAESSKGFECRFLMSHSNESAESNSSDSNYRTKELRIPTPYGHVAAKEWGNPKGKHKILCVHGWLDNAGSFDLLLPLLLEGRSDYHFVAMDHPGTGLSSHKPPGCEYTKFTMLIEIKRITEYLQWDKFTILGHSLGSHLTFMYACIYPECVLNVVSIDLTQPIIQSVKGWNIRSASSIREYLRFESQTEDDPEKNDKIPVYSELEALKRIMEAHASSLTEKSARVLMKRGVKKRRWGYTFTRDIRHKIPTMDPWPSEELTYQYMENVFRANLFVIRAKHGPYQVSEKSRLKFYDLYQKQCKVFRDVVLDGTHHLHMNDPEPVAKEIQNFFNLVFDNSCENFSPKL